LVVTVIVNVVPPAATVADVNWTLAAPNVVPVVGTKGVAWNGIVPTLFIDIPTAVPEDSPWFIGVRSVMDVVLVKTAEVNGIWPYSIRPVKLNIAPVAARGEYDVRITVDPVVPACVIYGPVVPTLFRTCPSGIAIIPFVDDAIGITIVKPLFPAAAVVYGPVKVDAFISPPKKVPVLIVRKIDSEFPIP
jgi:hypothetical protein